MVGPLLVIEITPPIFIADKGDLDVFPSLGDALAYVEPWDVTDDLEAFDASGRRLRIASEGVKRTRRSVGGGTTLLDERNSGDPAPDVLVAILRDYIERVGPARFGWTHEQVQGASLGHLVSAVALFNGCS